MKKQSLSRFTLNVVIPFISILLLLASGPSTSSLTFFGNHTDGSSSPNSAFAQQGQTILPQQATTNPNQTQQTQEPIITPSVVPRASQAEGIGNANTSVSGPNNSTQTQTNKGIVLLNQSFISDQPDDRIVGEVLNNGIRTAQFVKITASFYGINGTLLGSHMAYSDPNTIEPGNRAPFNILVTNGTISGSAETYGLNIQWKDINGNYKSTSVTENLALNNASGNVVNSVNNTDNINGGIPINPFSPSGNGDACDPSYPDVCIQSPPPDLDCPQIPYDNFDVVGADPHGLDGNNDGVGCEPSTGGGPGGDGGGDGGGDDETE